MLRFDPGAGRIRTTRRFDVYEGGGEYNAASRADLDIYDRIGDGDGFSAGVIHAVLAGLGPQTAVDHGAAHGALVMTTPGDAFMSDLAEVKTPARGGDGRTER
jgi:2-dehydro-3-deoxygluconokinase